ncbi:WXG100 family type VII secretion target [Mycobacteroides chelonae]|nr:WXG100 family type VII secretion target [Mycobacteroides chelonae]
MEAEGHRYRVDLEALESFADKLAAFDRVAEKCTSEVDARIRDLHTVWTGADAAAQAAYHQEWLEGFAQMRKVQEELEDSARASHFQYNQAIEHNRKMWPSA